MLAKFSTPPFIDLPPSGGNFALNTNRVMSDIPWTVAHPFGALFYCPAGLGQAHVSLNHHLIGFELDPGVVSLRIGDSPEITTLQRAKSFYFVPAGTSIEVRKETPIEHVLLTFDPRFFKYFPPLPHTAVHAMADSVFAGKALDFRRQFLKGHAVSHLAFELARVAVAAVARAYQSRAFASATMPVSYRLNADRMRRALCYIDNHCFRKISVADVANAVGNISAFHFAHAFECTLGQSPHQYVLEQRIRRAREMLMLDSIGVADVAYSVGFSSQAHMTNMFSRRLGITPAQVRKSIASLTDWLHSVGYIRSIADFASPLRGEAHSR